MTRRRLLSPSWITRSHAEPARTRRPGGAATRQAGRARHRVARPERSHAGRGRGGRGRDRSARAVPGGALGSGDVEPPAPGEGRALALDADDHLRAERVAAEAAGLPADQGSPRHDPLPRAARLRDLREAHRGRRRQHDTQRDLPRRPGRAGRQPRRRPGRHGIRARHALHPHLRLRRPRRRAAAPGAPPPRRRDLALRRILRGISNRGKVLGKIRSSLLGLERIIPFVAAACDGLGLPEDSRFETIKRDIESSTSSRRGSPRTSSSCSTPPSASSRSSRTTSSGSSPWSRWSASRRR